MKAINLIEQYQNHPNIDIIAHLMTDAHKHIQLKGLMGSAVALTASTLFNRAGKQQHVIVLPEKEQAAYFYNDLESLFGETDTDYNKKKVLFYPTTYKRPYEPENPDSAYQLSRTEVLKRFITGDRKTMVVTYPEALSEKVVTKKFDLKKTMKLKVGEEV